MKIRFIITSVISPSNRPLSYSDIRSHFDPNERYNQTIKTIDSIRQFVQDAEIVLIEGGFYASEIKLLKNKVDKFIYLGDNKIVRVACDSSFKGLGEAIMLIVSRLYLSNNFDLNFKISGRYFLNDKFNLNRWNNPDKIMGKVLFDGIQLSTRLLCIPKSKFNYFFFCLLISLRKLLKNANLEGMMIKKIGLINVKQIETIGISGNIGPNGIFISE